MNDKDKYGYEVYIGRYQGAVMYVGEGKKGRHKHLNSGTSALYQANKSHFEGKVLDIEIRPMQTKEEAERLEKELIASLSPAWNTNHHPKRSWAGKMRLLRNITRLEKREILKERYIRILKFFAKMANTDGEGEVTLMQMKLGLREMVAAPHTFVCDLSSERKNRYAKLQQYLVLDKVDTQHYKFRLVLDSMDVLPKKPKKKKSKVRPKEAKVDYEHQLKAVQWLFKDRWDKGQTVVSKMEAKDVISRFSIPSKVSGLLEETNPFVLHSVLKICRLDEDEYLIQMLED